MIDILNTLRARNLYNELLKFMVDLLMQHNVNLHVIHISGEHNIVVDLPCGQLSQASAYCPILSITQFQPPTQLVEAVSP